MPIGLALEIMAVNTTGERFAFRRDEVPVQKHQEEPGHPLSVWSVSARSIQVKRVLKQYNAIGELTCEPAGAGGLRIQFPNRCRVGAL
jgi:hypothetical protein